ncbi:hypothetical protein MLD38_038395 [Melastoma candidum]|uniref:Uncharacterized protein n=1 Tax=Melastoma candidum TaxID=119954 RepID=A0ACB9KZM0_9MYRT|nr:hypothetical protein MLD38_038395 [Melastoma candidum]
MDGNHHHLHPQHPHHHQVPWEPSQPWMNGNVDPSSLSSPVTTDRYPQWSYQETKEFLVIRDDLDLAFLEMKRNKLLWEVISSKMREKGYNRNADQCKCKWKNLVTRYKGCETSEAEEMRQQFPFFNDMQAIFGARMQKMLWAEEEGRGGDSSSRKKSPMTALFLEEEKEEEEEEEEDSEEGEMGRRRRKTNGKKKNRVKSGGSSGSGGSGEVRSLLEDFMKQQSEMEVQWREAFEMRESERRAKEMEWRQMMEALENERIAMDQMWREREEQRRVRAEARAEKRDAMVAALLHELRK